MVAVRSVLQSCRSSLPRRSQLFGVDAGRLGGARANATRRGFTYSMSWQQLSDNAEHELTGRGSSREGSREASLQATPRSGRCGGASCHEV